MSFEKLPLDLKNVVSDFAYCTDWRTTQESLAMCDRIERFNISHMFLRQQMWSWTYRAFLPNPIYCFEPIERYTGRWHDMFDWHAVNELLFRLDYRRTMVRVGGTRSQWFDKFRADWTTIRLFDAFYRILLHAMVPVFKPTYTKQRSDQLSTLYSPFQSARWVLEDYMNWGYH